MPAIEMCPQWEKHQDDDPPKYTYPKKMTRDFESLYRIMFILYIISSIFSCVIHFEFYILTNIKIKKRIAIKTSLWGYLFDL